MEQTLTSLGTPGLPLTNVPASASLDGIAAVSRTLAGPAPESLALRGTITASRPVDKAHLPNLGVAAAFASLLGAIALAYHPDVFDRPIARFVNQWAHRSALLDTACWSLDACFFFSGFVLTALLWFCWFEHPAKDSRARLLIGTLVAFPAGCISRLMQHKLATHPRPFYDPQLHFRGPYLMGDKPLNTWNSFPSDHVTVFAALLTTVCIVRPRLSKFIIPYFIIVESARTYMGAHYPSDLLGGAALGVLVVFAVQSSKALDFARRLLRWEAASPARFYTAAFALTWATSTLFLEPRTVGSYLLHALRHS